RLPSTDLTDLLRPHFSFWASTDRRRPRAVTVVEATTTSVGKADAQAAPAGSGSDPYVSCVAAGDSYGVTSRSIRRGCAITCYAYGPMSLVEQEWQTRFDLGPGVP